MARIGLNNFRYATLTSDEDGVATYGTAAKPGKAVSCNVSITNNSATLYADDALAESDTSFQSGTVTMGIDGHQISDEGEGDEIIRNANDTAPYIGLGRVVTKMVGGVYKYKVEFLCKVKFGEPSQEDTTKGESTEFATTEIEGTISTLSNGDWSKAQTFDTKTEAITYLESLFKPAGVGG